MTRWPSRRNVRCSASPMPVERMWPTCIGLATFGELKSMTMVLRLRRLCQKINVRRARRIAEHFVERGIFQPEIQEASAGDFHFLANVGNIQFGQNICRQAGADSFCALWRATSARCFGNRRISDRTGGRERRKHVGVRQNFADGGLQFQFDLFVRQANLLKR